jgi:hypothetical protein
LGARRPDESRQPDRAVPGQAAQSRFRKADPDAPTADAKIAGKSELETAADRGAVDRGDRRHGQAREPPQHHVLEQDLALARVLVQLAELMDVAAGAERARAAAVQDDAANAGRGDVVQRGAEAAQELRVDEVERGRPRARSRRPFQ